jgi:hypothetical protein
MKKEQKIEEIKKSASADFLLIAHNILFFTINESLYV